MKKLVIGAVLSVLGLYGISVFASAFFGLLAAIIPLLLIVGGGIAAYMGYADNFSGAADLLPETVDSAAAPAGPPAAGDSFQEAETSEAAEPKEQVQPDEPAASASASDISRAEEKPAEVEAGAAGAVSEAKYYENTGSRVFHRADCKYAGNKKCTAVFSASQAAL